jgi:hypothetical protein
MRFIRCSGYGLNAPGIYAAHNLLDRNKLELYLKDTNLIKVRKKMNTLDIKKMTTEEKLQAIDALWASLDHDSDKVKSPGWHAKVLRETEKRYKSGKEKVEDWAGTKKMLRQRFE